MRENRKTIAGLVAGLCLLLLGIGGCSGCEERILDDAEDWLREDPDRPGKVGTLVALEVSQNARDVAERRMKQGDDPCDIGWRLDEPFSVRYDLEIDVDRRSRSLRWSETGSWRRDADGRWGIDAEVEFDGVGQMSGIRRTRVFSDAGGFWEWLGPQVAARYESGATAERHWHDEFGGRFSGLMTLVSSKWQRSSDDEEERWVPGGQPRLCGPIDGRGEALSWRPLVRARTTLQHAHIRSEAGPDDGSTGRALCRVLEAVYEVASGGTMSLYFRECLGEAPAEIERPEMERHVEVRRDGSRVQMEGQLERWIEAGLVEVDPEVYD